MLNFKKVYLIITISCIFSALNSCGVSDSDENTENGFKWVGNWEIISVSNVLADDNAYWSINVNTVIVMSEDVDEDFDSQAPCWINAFEVLESDENYFKLDSFSGAVEFTIESISDGYITLKVTDIEEDRWYEEEVKELLGSKLIAESIDEMPYSFNECVDDI